MNRISFYKEIFLFNILKIEFGKYFIDSKITNTGVNDSHNETMINDI